MHKIFTVDAYSCSSLLKKNGILRLFLVFAGFEFYIDCCVLNGKLARVPVSPPMSCRPLRRNFLFFLVTWLSENYLKKSLNLSHLGMFNGPIPLTFSLSSHLRKV